MRDASISLFLLHPEIAPAILESVQTSEPAIAGQVATLLLATLYLQRLWSVRLTLALGHEPYFPEQPFTHLWKSRHLPPPAAYNGKWGLLAIDVFYFDFYSIALSKIQRASTLDINDVKLLLQQEIITLQELDTAYEEVLPQVGKGSYAKLDPQRFADRYTAVRGLL